MDVLDALLQPLDGAIRVTGEKVTVPDEGAVRERMDWLIREAVFGHRLTQEVARWLIWEMAQALEIRPASIYQLYMARGREEISRPFTVPALNLRMLAYDSARAAFRAALGLNAGAVIFELARSEMGYTDQRPSEYATAVLAAAIREGFRGPLFIQGDHFQVSAKKYAADPEAEERAIRDLIVESIAAGFYNLDIDASTLVDLSRPSLEDQQRQNYVLTAELTKYIRQHEPEGITISVGGEIGEVGGRNSTPEDLRAFMEGYCQLRGNVVGISKISIQTGTSHGGVVLPDGTLAQVAIDFEALRTLSEIARREYGMAGAVQHGASTLPEQAFGKFVEAGCCEVHLATAFQTLIFEHEAFSQALRESIYAWVQEHAAEERKPKDTEEQFLYRARKRAVGPFKQQAWDLPEAGRAAIRKSLEEVFASLFERLAVSDTVDWVRQFVKVPEIHRPLPATATEVQPAEVIEGLAD
ncbi:MAG: class II fructose-bisphosphate aldolase [Candidatus Tectomicrobia bacterium]|uniref:Class II fructose-bisphosphate aldolase n=1 Tax=Tectimicrobiota bacterium TaxID=2528274 RepID=A0A932CNU8_UNCTE|nr:class II fructose-bisphosphate aldolase [Candidatus Tectomicrobia bacterium]